MGTEYWKSGKGVALGAASFFAAGAVCAWTLMGAEPGSRADWVAAAGTWVIGAAACALTYQAGTAERKDRLADQRKHLRRMALQAHSLLQFSGNLEDLDKDKASKLVQFRTAVGAMISRCAAVKFDMLPVTADEELEKAVFDVEYNALALNALMQGFLERTKDQDSSFDVRACNEYRWMIETLGWLTESAKKLAERAESIRKQMS